MAIERDTYRIGVDVLPTGKVRARARGRKTSTRTFPEGTTPEEAAKALALKIEGDRLDSVKMCSSNGADKSDWKIYVSGEGI